MARPLPEIGEDKAAQLQSAWQTHTQAWQRQRLLVIRLVAQHALDAGQIAQASGVGRTTVFRYLKIFLKAGVEGLLSRVHKGGHPPLLDEDQIKAFKAELANGRFCRAKEVQSWIQTHTGKKPILSAVYKLLGKVGGALKVPRQLHAKNRRGPGGGLQAKSGGKTPGAPRNHPRKTPRLGAR